MSARDAARRPGERKRPETGADRHRQNIQVKIVLLIPSRNYEEEVAAAPLTPPDQVICVAGAQTRDNLSFISIACQQLEGRVPHCGPGAASGMMVLWHLARASPVRPLCQITGRHAGDSRQARPC